VAPGNACTVTVVFKPLRNGSLSAAVTIADNAFGSPQSIALTGTGSGPLVSLSATSLAFPATSVGKSAQKSFTLSNLGNAKLGKPGGGQLLAITGTNANSFSQTNSCNNGLAAGAKCTITVTFAPKLTGALSADVTFTDNAVPSPQLVKLSGTGQ
jgi:hypothetical protein